MPYKNPNFVEEDDEMNFPENSLELIKQLCMVETAAKLIRAQLKPMFQDYGTPGSNSFAQLVLRSKAPALIDVMDGLASLGYEEALDIFCELEDEINQDCFR